MTELNFDKAKCARCRPVSCLTRCQYMKLDKDSAKAEWQKIIEGQDSWVLDNCTTCYACEEYCPRGNHPFYLIAERQEAKGMLAPRPITQQWINMGQFTGKLKTGDVREQALSHCLLPSLRVLAKGKLFDGIATSWVYGPEFFCNAAYLHFSKMSVTRERLPLVIDNIRKQGIRELVCLHDECFGTFNSLAPAYGLDVPFKTTHYFELLYSRLKQHKSELKPLKFKVAYQRNCSARLIPHLDHFVDDIFDLIGVNRVERKYDRENALCCAAVIRMIKGYDMASDVQKRNLDDMADAGAEYCVFNCPACWDTLVEKVARRGLKPIHLIDLCKLAIGEAPSLEVPRNE